MRGQGFFCMRAFQEQRQRCCLPPHPEHCQTYNTAHPLRAYFSYNGRSSLVRLRCHLIVGDKRLLSSSVDIIQLRYLLSHGRKALRTAVSAKR